MSLAFSGISSAVLDPATAAAIWLFDNRNDLGKDSSKNAKEKLSTIWARLKAQ